MSTVGLMRKATIVPIMLEQLAIHAEGHETISIFRNTAKKCIRILLYLFSYKHFCITVRIKSRRIYNKDIVPYKRN